MSRHEVLRTRFVTVDGSPVQECKMPGRAGYREEDLRGSADVERAFASLAAEEGGRFFDVTRGPMIRALLVTLGEGEHGLVVTMHHLVSDGWSVGCWSTS